MADWTFDGPNKIIKEPDVGSGNLSWNVARDIYSAWKRWAVSNSQYDPAFIVEGGTPIGATGLFTGTSFILTNGWKFMAGDWDHISFINGNVFSDDGIDSVPNPSFAASLKTFGSVNAQGVSTGGVEQTTLNAIQVLVEELHRLQGLDPANPMSVTLTKRIAGDIDLDLDRDDLNDTMTVTRNPAP